MEAKQENFKENLIKRNKVKGHQEDENEGQPKKKDNFTQKKIKPIWMTQKSSDDKTRQPMYWNGRQWWCFGTKKKGKYDHQR